MAAKIDKKRTVYVASDSSMFNKVAVENLMKEFQDFGYRLERNWLTEAMTPGDCIEAAVNADYMVLLNASHSFGAMAELGARLAAKKVAIVLNGELQEYWRRHPLVLELHQSDLFNRLRSYEALQMSFPGNEVPGL